MALCICLQQQTTMFKLYLVTATMRTPVVSTIVFRPRLRLKLKFTLFQASSISENVSADILGRLEQRRDSRGGGAVKLKYGSAPVWICDAALRPEVGSMGRDSLLL